MLAIPTAQFNPHLATMESLKQISIRQFQPGDLKKVQKLFQQNLCSYKQPRALKESNFYFTKEKLKQDMGDIKTNYLDVEGANFWVAEEFSTTTTRTTVPTRIVACVGVIPHESNCNGKCNDDDEDDDLDECQTFELVRMSVHSDYRGSGLAQDMVRTLENFVCTVCPLTCRIFLTTCSEMKPACRFYEKEGFKRGQCDTLNVRDFFPQAREGIVHLQLFEKILHI